MPLYNLLNYSSNYSDKTGSLCFYCKDEAATFKADIVSNYNAKLFKYKAKLLGNSEADGANRNLRNEKIALRLKYLSNFWESLKM